MPTEAELRAAVASAEKVEVTAWKDTASTAALLDRDPEPAAIKDRRELPELDVTVVRFGNGVEAWFKPTDFKNDEVLFSLVSPGGTSLAPPEQFVEASLSTAQVQLSGSGGHNAVDLQRLLAGKIASASPTMSTVHRTASREAAIRQTSRPPCSCSISSSPRRETTPTRSR